MKRILISIALFVFVFCMATLLTFYIQRNSRPVILCTSLDDGMRPRDYCLMNPFRDKEPEILAEKVLRELKTGNVAALLPYLSGLNEDSKNHILNNEKRFRVTGWRIGDRKDTAETILITYWVSRENFDTEGTVIAVLEEVTFDFDPKSRELGHFSALY
jgi:hypothetical protein